MILALYRFVVLAVVCGLSLAAAAAPRAEHVFIISIDGGSPAVIHRSSMPVLQKLVKEGACTWAAQTIKPSITLPSHASMLTGVVMERHKITWNNWSPTNGLVAMPTVFSVAKAAGRSTAMFVAKEKFRHLALPDTVDEFNYDADQDVYVLKSLGDGAEKKKVGNVPARVVATHAARYIVERKPNLCFIHFTDPDTVGHEFGWGSPEQLQAFADVDAGLDLIVEAIRKSDLARRSVLLISADHGGHGKGHSAGTPEDLTIPWIAWGKGVKKGFTITAPVGTCDTTATVLWLLDLSPALPLDGVVVRSAFQ